MEIQQKLHHSKQSIPTVHSPEVAGYNDGIYDGN